MLPLMSEFLKRKREKEVTCGAGEVNLSQGFLLSAKIYADSYRGEFLLVMEDGILLPLA